MDKYMRFVDRGLNLLLDVFIGVTMFPFAVLGYAAEKIVREDD